VQTFHGVGAGDESLSVLASGIDRLDLAALPEGELRNELSSVADDLRRLLQKPDAEGNDLAVKAWVKSAGSFLNRASNRFKALRRSDLQTSLDRYKRRLTSFSAAAVAAVVLLGGVGTAVVYLTAPRIAIESATYGLNCHGKTAEAGSPPFQVTRGNVTAGVERLCQGAKGSCNVAVSGWIFGDPAPNCAKEFEVVWRCGGGAPRNASIAAEAMGKSLRLTCR
jgi:hypothetical protein